VRVNVSCHQYKFKILEPLAKRFSIHIKNLLAIKFIFEFDKITSQI